MTTNSLYKVHCYTFAIAQRLTGTGNVTVGDHPFLGFRCFPEFRTPSGKELRKQVCEVVRKERAQNHGNNV